MLHWLQKELVSGETADWIDDSARWVIQQFGPSAFWQHTQLVTPDASDFPQKVSGPEPMAQYILGRVTELAGVQDWPWKLCDVRIASPTPPQLLGIETGQRFTEQSQQLFHPSAEASLQVPFIIDQISEPQDLVASIASTCSQHILWQSQQTPPGGQEYFEQAAEMLAHFLGFGIMLTNSAYTYRGSCARCYNPRAHRQASLSEAESVYALALFCHLKKTPAKTVFKYLKPHLKGSFKLAQKQIKNRPPLFSEQDLLAAPI